MECVVTSPPATNTESRRVHWVDNLRVLVIAGVVVMHACTAYLGGADWYYMERTTSDVWSTVLTVPATIGAMFALGPLFLIAGWLSAGSLARRGAGQFARNRLLRLGVPLLVYIYLVDPLAGYVGALGEGRDVSLWWYLRVQEAEAGPMWFVAALLVSSMAYAGLGRVRRARSTSGMPFTARAIVVAAAAIAATAFLVWLAWPLDAADTFLNLRWGLWPQGAVLFGLGVHAREKTRVWAFAPTLRHHLGWATLGGLALLGTIAAVGLARGTLEAAPEGFGWWTLALALVYGALSVTATLWLVAWSQGSLTSQRPILQAAGRASYATYFLHPLVLTAIMAAFAAVALSPELKFLLVSVVAVPACFIAGQALLKAPGASRVL